MASPFQALSFAPHAPADRRAHALSSLGCGVRAGLSVATIFALAACGGTLEVGSLAKIGVTGQSDRVAAVPAEVYTRVARGANQCWFGARGILRESHVFYGEAAASGKSPQAEITVHERDRQGERPWGLKALRISMVGVGEETDVAIVNLKMPESDLPQLSRDVLSWAQGSLECSRLLDPPVIEPPPKKKPVRRAATATR
jgi:hypothetical protein